MRVGNRVVRAVVLMFCASALVACGAEETPVSNAQNALPRATSEAPSDGSVELNGSPSLEEIRKRGKLLVGLRAGSPEFAHRDADGDYGGFDVEIAKLLAEGIGLDPETDVSFRLLPPSLITDAMVAGNVDVQVGGVDPAEPRTRAIGPYAVSEGTRHFLAIEPGDDVMADELTGVMSAATADGRWQHAYESTLGAKGVSARPR